MGRSSMPERFPPWQDILSLLEAAICDIEIL